MLNSLPLLVAVLVSLLCTLEASAIDRNDLDDNLHTNEFSTQHCSRRNVILIIERPPPTVRLEPGKRLVLTCEVISKPSPSVQWKKNGVPAVDYEEKNNESFPVHPSSCGFMISKLVVTAASNGDVFTCVGTSHGRQVAASTTILTVEENNVEQLLTLHKLFRLQSEPIITTYLENISQRIGTAVVLPCRVHSTTAFRTFWHDKAGNVLIGHSRLQVLPSGSLLIRNLRWSDTGFFSCIAHNTYGRDVAETFVFSLEVV